MQWDSDAVAECLGCAFEELDCEHGFDAREARFECKGLRYALEIDQANCRIWLRADPSDPHSATPAFEFCFRADRIVVREGGCATQVISFENSAVQAPENPNGVQLVIQRLASGAFYIWPVIGGRTSQMQ